MPPRSSHGVCRSKVCAVCFGPGKVAVTPLLADRIKKFAHDTYSTDDRRFPVALCSSCQRWLYDKANNKESLLSDPNIFNISTLPDPPPATRSAKDENYDKNDSETHCYMCEVAHSDGRKKAKYNKWAKPGKPKLPLFLRFQCAANVNVR